MKALGSGGPLPAMQILRGENMNELCFLHAYSQVPWEWLFVVSKAVPVLDSLPVLLLLPELSPLVRTEIPLKLLALVTAGFKLRRELSESVLLQGRGSEYFSSLSVLL